MADQRDLAVGVEPVAHAQLAHQPEGVARGPGPRRATVSALVPGSTVQRPESSAASARPWSSVGVSSGSGPKPRSGSSHGAGLAGRVSDWPADGGP